MSQDHKTGVNAGPTNAMGRRKAAATGLVWLVMAVLLGACSRERIIGLNERIHHDDFEYRVAQFQVADSIGSGEHQRKASGRFYIVTFEVENRARRVNHSWDDTIAYVVDEHGRSYENLPEMQKILDEAQPFNYVPRHSTPPGTTESTRFVFDLPRDQERPCLMVRGELLMGDVFDGKAFTRTKVRLY